MTHTASSVHLLLVMLVALLSTQKVAWLHGVYEALPIAKLDAMMGVHSVHAPGAWAYHGAGLLCNCECVHVLPCLGHPQTCMLTCVHACTHARSCTSACVDGRVGHLHGAGQDPHACRPTPPVSLCLQAQAQGNSAQSTLTLTLTAARKGTMDDALCTSDRMLAIRTAALQAGADTFQCNVGPVGRQAIIEVGLHRCISHDCVHASVRAGLYAAPFIKHALGAHA